MNQYLYLSNLLIMSAIFSCLHLACDSQNSSIYDEDEDMITSSNTQTAGDLEPIFLGNYLSDDLGEFTFEVPIEAQTSAMTIVIEVLEVQATLEISRVESSEGTLIIGLDDNYDEIGLTNTVQNLNVLSFLYPASPQWPWDDTAYEVSVTTLDERYDSLPSLSCDVYVLFKEVPIDQPQNLDLLFWFTQGDYLSASEAETDNDFQDIIQQLKTIYDQVDVNLNITYQDVNEADAAFLAVIEDDAQKEELFDLGSNNRNVMNVFIIDEIVSDENGFATLGEASSIPIVPAHESLNSVGGVVISGLLMESNRRFAETIAHEVGHALGLMHTTEQDGNEFDPLMDTKKCTLNQDRDDSMEVSAEECITWGADNLMFWTPPNDPNIQQNQLTNDQQFVMYNHMNTYIESLNDDIDP